MIHTELQIYSRKKKKKTQKNWLVMGDYWTSGNQDELLNVSTSKWPSRTKGPREPSAGLLVYSAHSLIQLKSCIQLSLNSFQLNMSPRVLKFPKFSQSSEIISDLYYLNHCDQTKSFCPFILCLTHLHFKGKFFSKILTLRIK